MTHTHLVSIAVAHLEHMFSFYPIRRVSFHNCGVFRSRPRPSPAVVDPRLYWCAACAARDWERGNGMLAWGDTRAAGSVRLVDVEQEVGLLAEQLRSAISPVSIHGRWRWMC